MRVGLWEKESKKGNTYLAGINKETSIKYMVFKNDEGISKLVSKDLNAGDDAPLVDLTVLSKGTTSEDKTFFKGGEYAIFTNDYFEEGSNKPHFNLVIGD